MIDPRFEQVLEFIDELDDDGVPSIRAKLAIKISAYAKDVDNARNELRGLEEDVGELQTLVDSQTVALGEQADRRIDLVTQAQDAAVRAAMSGSGGASARLRKEAKNTRERIAEFGKDFDIESSRLAQSKNSLEAKKHAIKDQRDSIVRRLNTMSSLADRAGMEVGPESNAPSGQTAQPRQQVAQPRMMRRRPRRVRIRRRRAS